MTASQTICIIIMHVYNFYDLTKKYSCSWPNYNNGSEYMEQTTVEYCFNIFCHPFSVVVVNLPPATYVQIYFSLSLTFQPLSISSFIHPPPPPPSLPMCAFVSFPFSSLLRISLVSLTANASCKWNSTYAQ